MIKLTRKYIRATTCLSLSSTTHHEAWIRQHLFRARILQRVAQSRPSSFPSLLQILLGRPFAWKQTAHAGSSLVPRSLKTPFILARSFSLSPPLPCCVAYGFDGVLWRSKCTLKKSRRTDGKSHARTHHHVARTSNLSHGHPDFPWGDFPARPGLNQRRGS